MTLPLNFALTGPTLAVTWAWNSVSEVFSSSSQPAIDCFRTSGSLSAAQTSERGRGLSAQAAVAQLHRLMQLADCGRIAHLSERVAE